MLFVSSQQVEQFLATEGSDRCMFLGDDRICQILFAGLELEDLLLDRILGDQFEDADDLFLTDPVGHGR